MSGQKPMAKRLQEMLEYLWKNGPVSAHRLDRTVLKRLIKKGKAKMRNCGSARHQVGGRTYNMVSATDPAPKKEEEPETGGPYAKRREALEESGLSYKGKNFGKIRLDLPREEREKKITEKALMWKKLKRWKTHK